MGEERERASRRGVKLRRYTDEERARVLADVPTLGGLAAAKKHGVPDANVFRWLKETKSTARNPLSEGDAAARTSHAASQIEEAAAPVMVATIPTAASSTPIDASSKPTQRTRSTTTEKRIPTKKVARSYTPSERADILEHAAAHTVLEASTKFGVSPFSVYDWRRKLTTAAAGLGPSPTSGPSVADIETRRDSEILGEWKLHPGLGPSQIRNQLRRKNIKVSVHTVRIVMETAGYRPPKVQRHPHDQRFESVRPNHLWHLDFVHRNIHLANTFTLILIDDHSRFVVGQGVDDAERADMVIQTFERAATRYGRPEMVMHDRGSAFWAWKGISRFTRLLTEMGIDQIVAIDKEHNGKVEVFNANLAKELFDVQRFADVGEMRRRLDTHIHWYNHGRTHHALGGLLVPADRYYGRVDEVLARIEAGAGRDVGDGIDLRARSLDLFKVISRDGVPEVWLMGKKLLELRP